MSTVALIWFGFAIGVAMLAKQRGRGPVAWFFIAMLLSPLLAFVVLMMLKDLDAEEFIESVTHDMDLTHVKCHKCAEYVLPEATVCKYCGASLTPQPDYVKKRVEEKVKEAQEIIEGRRFNFLIAGGIVVGIVIIITLLQLIF